MKREEKYPFLLHLLPLLLFFSFPFGLGAEQNRHNALISSGNSNSTTFDIGVILDTSSWIGNISWSCMRMAVADFYAANPGYSTRISLHLRDSGGNAFRATAAAIDLLKNVQVQAIIGPQTSAETRFVMKLGDRAHVPIMSFSAIIPSLSSLESPYFIHTSLIDSIQVKVIASIVQKFRWSQVVPVFEDTEHGNGIVPYLIDAFQKIYVHVPYRSIIPLSASKDQILKELNKLKSMQTRVFVVHLTCNLGLEFFSIAKEERMLEEGYVWITTYSLIDVVHMMGSSATNVMQGVVGIKPYVNETRKLHDFKQRWRKKFQKKNPHTQITEPTFFGLWAYDTIWSLALAVKRIRMTKSTSQEMSISHRSTDLADIGLYSSGPELLQSIQGTSFDGMAGKFCLINNQLQFQNFEIINVARHGQRRIGFWSPKYGTSGWRNSIDIFDVVTWPGGTKVVPKGWEWPIRGKKLQIAVPLQPPFNKFLHAEGVPHSNNVMVDGYCIDVFQAVMKELLYAPYEFIPYGDNSGRSNGTYDDLIYQVSLQKFDAMVGDVTIIANRSLYVDFTLPYTESGVSMLIPVKDQREKGAWTFLEPLDTKLWLSIGAFFIFTGFVIWVLEHRINTEFRGSPTDQIGTVLYFSFSSLVFAHREKLLGNLSRIVMIVWLFVVFILQSTYTARLSSMLTVEQLQPTVRDLNDLIKQGMHVGYMNNSFMPILLKRWKLDESKLIPFNSPKEYHEALSNGTLAVFLDETPYLKFLQNEHCGKYTMVQPIYKTDGFGFAFPKGSPLVHDVSKAILKFLGSDEMLKIEEKLYGSKMCTNNADNGTNLISMTFHSFWGLFLMTGVVSITALTLNLASFLYAHRKLLCCIKSNKSIGIKLLKLAKLYDQMDTVNAPNVVKSEGGGAAGDVMTPGAISGLQSPLSTTNHVVRNVESEQEIEASFDGEASVSELAI